MGMVELLANLGAGSAIVYYKSKAEVEYQASRLGCGVFHSTSRDAERVLRDWLDGQTKVIVATGALRLGIDMASMRLVIHRGIPFVLVDFVQESERRHKGRRCLKKYLFTKT